ncbi:hypothetical protein YC2023_072181 [Brassica napus]
MIKWRCCPRSVQFLGFSSVEVMNCSEAKEGAVRVEFSPDQYQGRFCTSQDQSSPVQSRRPLGFGHALSDQPAASCLEHCELACCFLGLVPSGFKETPYSLDREDSDERCHVLWLSITRRCNVAVTRRTVGCRAVTRRTVGRGRLKGDRILPIERRNTKSPGPRIPLLEAKSWQEAKSNLVTVAGRGRQLTE